jgi:hypothetical protein
VLASAPFNEAVRSRLHEVGEGSPVAVSRREGKMTKCRHPPHESLFTDYGSLITIFASLLSLSKKAPKPTQNSPQRNRNSDTGDFVSEMSNV